MLQILGNSDIIGATFVLDISETAYCIRQGNQFWLV